jgi:PAS domain S-box-containing protein
MIVTFILTLSILLQFVAAFIAFRLIPLTGRRLAWSLISAALMLMALRRCVTFIRMLFGNAMIRPDFNAELIALMISILMVVGISRIAPIFDDRKRAEAQAARVGREWQSTFDATNDAILILDQDQQVLRSNKTAERFFHRPFEEMIGKHCCEIVHGMAQPIPECPLLRVRKSMHRETMERQEGERWFEVIVDPILDAAGRYSGAVHIVSDITDRKRAEQEMSMIAEIGRVVSSTLDINRVFERVDSEVRKLIPYDRLLVNLKKDDNEFISAYACGVDNPGRRLGGSYPSKRTATGVVITTRKGLLIQPANAEEIKDLYPNLYETFKTGLRSTMSVPLISMDEVIGSLIFRSKKLKAYAEQDLRLAERIGMQIEGAIANAELFHERMHAEEERKSLQERLQRAEKMQALGQLAGGVAHDLNNVLGIMSGYSELLMEEIPEGSPGVTRKRSCSPR